MTDKLWLLPADVATTVINAMGLAVQFAERAPNSYTAENIAELKTMKENLQTDFFKPDYVDVVPFFAAPPIMLPASHDHPCFLWKDEDGLWQWSIPELKIRGWGFDTIDDAKHHVHTYLRLPANRGAVWHECKTGVYAQGLQDETDD